jgi:putative PIN family toxin of toxin-antitoxin system
MVELGLIALIDTNIWISAFLNPAGPPAQVLRAFYERQFVPVTSQVLLAEIEDVLSRERVRRRLSIDAAGLTYAMDRLNQWSIKTEPTGELRLCRDSKDNFLLEMAMLSSAQYLVSRDDDTKRDLDLIAHLRANGVEVVSVTQFLVLLAAP